MTLKAAWITPLGPRGPFTLTLESDGVEGPDRLPVHEMVFPETPADAPKRHTVALSCLNTDDLRLLQQLLADSLQPTGRYEQAVVKLEEDDFPMEDPHAPPTDSQH